MPIWRPVGALWSCPTKLSRSGTVIPPREKVELLTSSRTPLRTAYLLSISTRLSEESADASP